MEYNCLLTTFDNPFDPYEQFDKWFLFDMEKGYNTCGTLMRIAHLSDELSEREQNIEIERAINEIIDNDVLCIYRKVTHALTPVS